MSEAKPMKFVIIYNAGRGEPVIIAARTKKRILGIINDDLHGYASMGYLNDYHHFHTSGAWWERFAHDGEGVWRNRGRPEHSKVDSPDWERILDKREHSDLDGR